MGYTDKYPRHLLNLAQNLWLAALTLTLLTACNSPVRLQGSDYVHLIYQHPAKSRIHQNEELIVVFIEGDGIPWVAHGTEVAKDPTPIHALAYNLYKATPQAAWYLTRPCYNHVRDSHCSSLDWTDARYSETVVVSMVTAINTHLQSHPASRLVLVGYSGGGALAVLMASRIPQVKGVITIAGNLDIDAWTRLHGYQPLKESLNPVDTSELVIPHIDMIGDHDINIPLSSIEHYLQRHPHTIVQRFPDYDHVCCWEKNWPALLHAALGDMNIEPR